MQKKIFDIRADEEIIHLTTDDSISVLEKYMNKSRGKKGFFILFEGYYNLRQYLINKGFVEGQDFINAAMFLSDANGIKLNTYPLVRNM